MGDNATEIDLDSVIDRLLEGTSPLLARKIVMCGCRETSVGPVFGIAGGIHSLRASYHWATYPTWFAATVLDLKERRKSSPANPGCLCSLLSSPRRCGYSAVCHYLFVRLTVFDGCVILTTPFRSPRKSTWKARSAPRVRNQISLHQSP